MHSMFPVPPEVRPSWLERALALLHVGPLTLFAAYLPLHLVVAWVACSVGLTSGKVFVAAPGAGLLFAAATLVRRRRWGVLVLAAVIAEVAVGLFSGNSSFHGAKAARALPWYVFGMLGSALIAAQLLRPVLRRQGLETLEMTFRGLAIVSAGVVGMALLLGVLQGFVLGIPKLLAITSYSSVSLLGLLLVGLPIVTAYQQMLGRSGQVAAPPRTIGIGALAVALSILVFSPVSDGYDAQYVLFPALTWLALQGSTLQVSLTASTTALVCAIAHANGFGPFVQEADRLHWPTFALQFFLITLLGTTYLVAVAVNERRNVKRRLLQAVKRTTAADIEARVAASAALHDGIAQILFAMNAQVTSLRRVPGLAPTSGELESLAGMIDAAQRETRAVMSSLTVMVPVESTLRAGLEGMIAGMRGDPGLDVEFHQEGDIPAEQHYDRMRATRVVRELLLNVYKHSGTPRAQVLVRVSPSWIEIAVADGGRGFPRNAPSEYAAGDQRFGLHGVRLMAESSGGDLVIHSLPGQGVTVQANLGRG